MSASVTEPTRPPLGHRQPLDALDKACLAAAEAPWSSFAPTWRLVCRGRVDPAQLTRALAWTVARYPWCGARVRDGAWLLAADGVGGPTLEVLDLRAEPADARQAREEALLDRFVDVETSPPLSLTWVRHTDDESALVFQQQHALADGRAFFALLADFQRCLAAAAAGGRTSPLPEGAVARRAEDEVVAERGLARAWTFVRGALHSLAELLRVSLSPPAPLASNTPTDFTGANRTRHLDVSWARLEGWAAGRRHLGLSLNDVLAGAVGVAVERWSAALGAPRGPRTLLFPVDARPREGFESFANHLTSLQLRWASPEEDTPLALARRLHDAAAPRLAARLPWRRVLFDRLLGRLTPLPTLRRELLVKRRLLTCLSFSNLVPLGTPGADADGRWRAGGLTVERLLVTTPCTPPQALNVTAVRYGDGVTFNLNFKASALTPAKLEALSDELGRALDEVDAELAPQPPGRPGIPA